MFKTLLRQGADILTYRKGNMDPIPAEAFSLRPDRPGEPDWLLHDAPVVLRPDLTLRQITRRVGSHQTAIVTSRMDLSAEVLAARMFDRWRQENFFKYMRQEFDLDGMVEYGAEAADPRRVTPNPEWNRRNKILKAAKVELQEALARTVDRGHPDVLAASARVDEFALQRKAIPRRVAVGDLPTPTVRLHAQRKRLYDGLKTVAYQIETDLVNTVAPFYRRAGDEGRTLVTSALRSRGHLDVTARELKVFLSPQSSAHRTEAIAELCRILDDTTTRFPGTSLRLRYQVLGSPENGKSARPEKG